MPRGASWSEAESTDLSKAWLTVSEDPIIGKDQDSTAFFVRIWEHWKTLGPQHSGGEFTRGRSAQACKSRWQLMSKEISKFCGCVRAAIETLESGKTLIELVEDAKELYKAQKDGKEFEFLKAWEAVKKSPKFKLLHSKKLNQKLLADLGLSSVSDSSRSSESGTEEPVDLTDQVPDKRDGSSPQDSGSVHSSSSAEENCQVRKEERPQGNKRAKTNESDLVLKQRKIVATEKLAEATQEKTLAMIESNALGAFVTKINDVDEDAREGIRLLRKKHLTRLREEGIDEF